MLLSPRLQTSAYDCGARPRALHEARSGASGLPLALPDHLTSIAQSPRPAMALDEAMEILEVLAPIAKAVPILGAPVEGSLEALSKILKFAQVRHLCADLASLDVLDF
jgi:hypothetical protein